VQVVAGASPTAGTTYTPISAGTWATGSGTASFQAVGGTWDVAADGSGTHVFTVSSAAAGAAGSAVSIDTNTQQRMLITDGGNGMKLGASFLATTASNPVSLTATSVTSGPTLTGSQTVLDGWTFSAVSGYNDGTDPNYLSLSPGRYYPPVRRPAILGL